VLLAFQVGERGVGTGVILEQHAELAGLVEPPGPEEVRSEAALGGAAPWGSKPVCDLPKQGPIALSCMPKEGRLHPVWLP
jgi:hypothetical protein